MIFQALVYERLVRCAGLVALLRWSLAVQGACFVVTPFAVSAVSAAPAAVQWAIVAPIFIIRTLAQVG